MVGESGEWRYLSHGRPRSVKKCGRVQLARSLFACGRANARFGFVKTLEMQANAFFFITNADHAKGFRRSVSTLSSTNSCA